MSAPSPKPPLSTSTSIHIGGMRIDAGTYDSMTQAIIARALSDKPSAYVAVSNVHMTMEARDSRDFQKVVNDSFLVTSDGMPLVWVLRKRGHSSAERVYGPTLMLHVCEAAAAKGVPIALYGGAPEVLNKVCSVMEQRYPSLQIVCRISPPFGPMSAEQDRVHTHELEASGAKIIFVGLGCPKQERWMAAHKDKLPAIMLGVGAAFNFHAGHVRQSPAWLQKIGMEWAFRFAMEPRRLWKRYCWHNPRFIWLVLKEQLFGA